MSFKEPKLWKHQQSGVELASLRKSFAFLFDVGTGKTLTAISTLRRWFKKEQELMPTLILSPKVTLDNWKSEFAIFSKIPKDKVLVLKGPTAKRQKQLDKAIAKYGRSLIVITNYEGLRSQAFFSYLSSKFGPRVLVCDESHRCKTHNSKTTKMVTLLADKAEYKLALTGTLVTNSEFDIFSQWRILDGGRAFGRNFFHFRNKYFYDKNAGMPRDKYFPDWRIRSGSHEDMQKKMEESSLKALKEDCIDLPELVSKKIEVDMTPSQRKMYNELSKNLVAEIQEGAFTSADLALTKVLRLAQIASGFIKDDDGNIHRIKNEKEAALKDFLFDVVKEGGNKVIVWAVFKENYKQIREICESLKIENVVEGHGGIKDVAGEVKRFDDSEGPGVLIGHPASIGIGVNIKSAAYRAWFSRDFSLEKMLQANARNYRGGSVDLHDTIFHYDFVTKETVEEAQLLALAAKITTSDKIMDLVKSSLGV